MRPERVIYIFFQARVRLLNFGVRFLNEDNGIVASQSSVLEILPRKTRMTTTHIRTSLNRPQPMTRAAVRVLAVITAAFTLSRSFAGSASSPDVIRAAFALDSGLISRSISFENPT